MAVAMFTLFYGTAITIFGPQWYRLERIAHNGTATIGRVLAKEAENHESVRYEYYAAGTRLIGVTSAGVSGVPPFNVVKVGDTIPIRYRTKKPIDSVAGDSPDAYYAASFFIFVLIPAVCLLLSVVGASGLRRGATWMWPDIISSAAASVGRKREEKGGR
jgi:hypothetical protein